MRIAMFSASHSLLVDELETVLCECSELICHYQWIWDVNITKFFLYHHWNNIPTEWWDPLLLMTNEEINQLPFGRTECDWPDSLRCYVKNCNRLCLDRTVPEWVESAAVPVGVACRRKMTPKKQHEVSRMAGVIAELCKITNCCRVLDIGSGLGYLGHVLTESCQLDVIGIEKDEKRVVTAQSRTQTVHLNITHTLETRHKFKSILQDMRSAAVSDGGGRRNGVCLVGLHTCGDLTPNILRMTSGQMTSDLSATIIVGCCYHKMVADGDGSQFLGFPISAYLREKCPELCRKMSVFGLRLGCQETRVRWRDQSKEDHTHHQNKVYYRAVLQAVKPNLGKIKVSKSATTFEEFVETTAHLGPELGKKLKDYHSTHHHYTAFIQPFTALQVCMQGVIERLIVTDRLMFLNEQGHSPIPLPLFNDFISPRSVAIVTINDDRLTRSTN